MVSSSFQENKAASEEDFSSASGVHFLRAHTHTHTSTSESQSQAKSSSSQFDFDKKQLHYSFVPPHAGGDDVEYAGMLFFFFMSVTRRIIIWPTRDNVVCFDIMCVLR